MKKIIFLLLLIILFIFLFFVKSKEREERPIVTSFNECLEAGYMIMESYPRQCRTPDGVLFVENIGNILEKVNLIRVSSLVANDRVSSPLNIFGEARGYWFFEADFPVELINSSGDIISFGIATANDDWMTEDFVSFDLVLEFDKQLTGSEGKIVFKKDNPSGLIEHDDFLEIPIIFN
ncbi:MAG: Gmad2 immunoglobulin-like domain-containing protein [Patescibacteria group bacterium]